MGGINIWRKVRNSFGFELVEFGIPIKYSSGNDH